MILFLLITKLYANSFFDNPALLATHTKTQVSSKISVGKAVFEPFQNIRIASSKYATSSGSTEKVDSLTLQNVETTLWSIALSTPFNMPIVNRRSGLGLKLEGPFGTVRSLEAKTPYDFQHLRYGTYDHQFKAKLAMGISLNETFSVGSSVSLFMTTASSASARVLPENPSAQMSLNAGFNTSPAVGVHADFQDVKTGLYYQHEINPIFRSKIISKAQVTKDAETLDVPLELKTSLYYEPTILFWDASYDFGGVILTLGVDYEFWSHYEPSFITVETTTREAVITSEVDAFKLNNTLSPKVKCELPVSSSWVVGLGYRFRKSPISDEVLRKNINLLDSDTHILLANVSYGWAMQNFVSLEFQSHFLSKRTIQKEDPLAIGYPSYDFSGRVYSLGLGLSLSL